MRASLQTGAIAFFALLALIGPAPGDNKQPVEPPMKQWEKEVRDRLQRSDKLKALAAKYPLVLLHSRALYAGGDYKRSAYSFIYESSNEQVHGNDVQLLFHNGGTPNTFDFNMMVRQQNLVVDLGQAAFEKDPDPRKINIDDPGVLSGGAPAVEGHVYLERVRDGRGNNFYVVFQVVAVDKGSRYMAFIWRKLPGGKVIKQPRPAGPVS